MKRVIIVALAVTALMILGALAVPIPTSVDRAYFSPAVSSSNNGTFTVGTLLGGETVSNLNPLSDTGLSSDVAGVMYADSMAMEFNNGSYIPWTASSWSVSNGGSQLTFNLVHNATWVNGTSTAGQFTSQDVIYTFQALKANSSIDVNQVDGMISSFYAPNQYTVVFNLTAPSVMAFFYIAGQTIIPYAWHNYVSNISQVGSYFNLNIGHELTMGPMYLQSVSGNYITFAANDHYFKGKPKFQKEVWEQFSSTSSQIDSLQTGAIQATYVDSNSVYPTLQNLTGISTYVFKETFNLNLWFDDKVAPYNNTNFRIGLAYLINNTQIANKAEAGLAGPANSGGLPWTMSAYYNKSTPAYNYNVTQANKYFKLAGLSINSTTGLWQYPNGTTVSIQMIDIPQSDWDTAMSLIQSALTADSFSTTLSIIPTGTWANDLFSSNPNFTYPYMSFFNFGPLLGNPWYDLWALTDTNGSWNLEYYSNPTLDHLFNESSTMVNNPAQLNATLQQIQGIISSQLPVIPVVGSDLFFAYRSDQITGIYPGVQMSSPLDSLYVSPVNGTASSGSGGSGNLNYYYIGGGVAAVLIVAAAAGLMMRGRNRKKE